MPSGLVITSPWRETATNIPLPCVTDCQPASAAWVRLVQVMPSGLVITLLRPPAAATATNVPSPYVTESQELSAAEVRLVQVMPSGLVITRLPAPVQATATNNPLPYVTECQSLSVAEVRIVQSVPVTAPEAPGTPTPSKPTTTINTATPTPRQPVQPRVTLTMRRILLPEQTHEESNCRCASCVRHSWSARRCVESLQARTRPKRKYGSSTRESQCSRDFQRIEKRAPGMIRTCDARCRKWMLYPLSYGGDGGILRRAGTVEV